MPASAPAPPGLIQADCLYTKAELGQRLRLGEWAWRMFRRRGLRTVKIGRQVYIKGCDVLAAIDAMNT